jgi:WD40 repeat protein
MVGLASLDPPYYLGQPMKRTPPPTCLALLGLLALAFPAQAAESKPKTTYMEHVRPILREHCFACHNQNKAKNDLVLDSYERIMKGGASGEAVKPGEPDDSYLWKLVSHQDEPNMPPNQEKLPAAKLAVIKQWILDGALKDSGSTASAAKPKTELAMAAGAERPAGPAVIPTGLPPQPITHTARAGAVLALAESPWAPVFAVGGQKQVLLYHSDTTELLGVLPFPEGLPQVLHFSRSGTLLLVGGGHAAKQGRVAIHDVRSGRRLFEVGDELDTVLGADINASHTRIALGGPEKLIRVYSADGALVQEIKKHTDWVYAVEYSPDGVLLATGDRSGGLLVWEADTLQEYQDLQGHQGAVTDVSWRPDSNVLASASEDGTIRLWEMREGKQLRSIKAHDGGVLSVRFTHDGRFISTGRDRRVKLWSSEGQPLRTIGPLDELPLRAVFTHDGKRVIAGDFSGRLTVWDVSSDGPKEVARLSANPSPPPAKR